MTFVFFFKQKTAYEMRISDWSSDVCSSDLALSGIAAEGLEHGSGIASRTLASLEHKWADDRDRLTRKHIPVIDEAGMVGTRQLERGVSEAERQGERKSGGEGKSVSGRLDAGGRGHTNKKKSTCK